MLRYMHGLLPEQWQAMLREQDGRCYLCKQPLPSAQRRNVIDHDWGCCQPIAGNRRSGSCSYCRRGLACNNCNAAIGMLGDDPQRLRLVADNLERAQAITGALRLTKPEQGVLDVQEDGAA
jgi:hypothetical protein